MPANLTPEYKEAEREYRAATSDADRLRCLEQMLRVIPKHKGTDKMQADLRRRISKLKEKIQAVQSSKKGGFSYKIPKEGAGSVALVGAPNTGKTQLFQALTGVEARVAEYPYTTMEPQPGMMPFENIQIELVDFPPVSEEHTENWVFDLIKSCDAFLLLVDLDQGDPLVQFNTTIRLLEKKYLLPIWDDREVETGTRVPRPGLLIANKCDAPDGKITLQLFEEMFDRPIPIHPVSAEKGMGIEDLREKIYRLLGIIRVFSKAPGKPADMDSPFTVPKGSTLLDFANHVHHDFAENLKTARLWGSSKFDGMMVKQDHVLEEGDVVELHI